MPAGSQIATQAHGAGHTKKDRPYAPYYLKLAQNDQVSINRVLVPAELDSIRNSKFYRMFLEG